MDQAICCVMECDQPAEWEIIWSPPDRGTTVDDYTQACTEHVGELCWDTGSNNVYRLADA